MASAWEMMFNYSKAQSEEKKLNKQLANMPQYEIPKEIGMIQSMAEMNAAKQMTGYGQSKTDIGQAGAEANYYLGQSAINSNVAQEGAQAVLDKQLKAYQALNTQSAQWKDAQQDKLKQAYELTAQQKVEQWIQNQLRPWEIKTGIIREDQLGALSTARSSTPQDEDIMSSIFGFAGSGGG